jgi:glycerol kinase
MKYILALDQGTTSSRAILFNHEGSVVATAQKEFPQLFPKPGWVEHDPAALWSSQWEVTQLVLEQAKISPSDIAALGITNQRETTLVWDRRTGQPVCNAIVWQDRRTADACEALRRKDVAADIRRRTGLVVDAYFSATKIQWILDNIPGARARARRGELAFGTVDSWLIWNLTGGRLHVTDASNASRTMLYNLRTGDWDPVLLKRFGIPRPMLPEIRSSSGVLGEAMLGSVPIPIAGVAGDQQAALFGQVCHAPGLVKNTYGTGCFMLMHTGTQPVTSRNNLLTTVAWQIGGKREFALEGSVFIAGAAVQWLRDGLSIIRTSAEVESLAASIPDPGGVYVVPAFAGLGAPQWDPHARGLIIGITRGTTAAHVARATLEGIGFQVADLLRAMERDTGIRLKELRVDGGASANNLLMQFQSDILGVPVARPRVSETTALGAAYLAGLAVGFWKNRTEIARQWQMDRRFRPTLRPARRQELVRGWERALKRAGQWEEGAKKR